MIIQINDLIIIIVIVNNNTLANKNINKGKFYNKDLFSLLTIVVWHASMAVIDILADY